MKKICLCMIVKNESAIITRCLEAAKPVIDYAFIVDTGSTDGTQDIVRTWLAHHHITGEVYEEAFSNFGYNRSSAVQHATKTYPDADYLLILDADEVLEVGADFSKDDLVADGYMTMQYNRSLKYWYHRLLKTGRQWECVGVTHEYWTSDSPYPAAKLHTLVVRDFGDGGSKRDKFKRDEQLLLEGLRQPDLEQGLKSRYLFYLANTYHDTSQFREAIRWYRQRIEAGGWVEEVFYSYYRIGLCYRQLARQSDREQHLALAAAAFLDAWNFHPVRAEPLYELSQLYREEKKYQLAALYAKVGCSIPYPKDDVLFINYPVYDYLLDYELSISAYYVDRGLAEMKQRQLEARADLPLHVEESVKSNSRFYD